MHSVDQLTRGLRGNIDVILQRELLLEKNYSLGILRGIYPAWSTFAGIAGRSLTVAFEGLGPVMRA